MKQWKSIIVKPQQQWLYPEDEEKQKELILSSLKDAPWK